ncbi:hypothetical protein [Kitasatospora sp. NPDC017646]|uniref:hypothetical protein n=1 Tax=Kitasatospora sp. NPDC017646 TaxID=3364024 RepID=UPI00379B3753
MAGIDGALKDAMAIDGALGAALVDSTSGMALGMVGDSAGLDLQLAAAGTTDVVRAHQRAAEALGLHGEALEDSLTTLTHQYHLVRPLTSPGGNDLFLYLVLDRARANLAMARHHVRRIDAELVV